MAVTKHYHMPYLALAIRNSYHFLAFLRIRSWWEMLCALLFYNSGILKLECADQSQVVSLLNLRALDSTCRVSDSVGLGCGLRTCISNKFPGDADAAGLGTTLCGPPV